MDGGGGFRSQRRRSSHLENGDLVCFPLEGDALIRLEPDGGKMQLLRVEVQVEAVGG
jgi:hypothetical protein